MSWLDHHEAGHHLIQLFPIAEDGRCGCGNPSCPPESAGKHPRSKSWNATPRLSDEAAAEAASDGRFDHGYGVLCKGLLVVDVDERNGGIESLRRLEKRLGFSLGRICGYVVQTGSGGDSHHLYFKAPEGLSLSTTLPEYKGIDFKSSGFVVGCGSAHASGNTYNLWAGSPYDIEEAPPELIEIIKQPELIRAQVGSVVHDISPDDIKSALSVLDPSCEYDKWIRIGMAIHHATGGADQGFDLWDRWSSGSKEKYPSAHKLSTHWHSFGKNSRRAVTIGTLFQYALDAGWVRPAHLRPRSFEPVRADGCPIDLGAVDLLRPPDFAGEVFDYIDGRCLFPRKRLAVAATLVTLGNVGGLRWIDDLTGVTSNLFAFCVAASATGKEAVQDAMIQLMAAANLSPAVHGRIKSTQEITRNLVRHQAAYYIIDELGIALRSIVQARQRGGAPYLDEVIGELMKVYSKANGIYLVSGDVKAELQADLAKAAARARREEQDDVAARLEQAIENINSGIPKPFLSMIGFSTETTLSSIMSYEQSTAGFIGRAVLVRETDSNPKPRPFGNFTEEVPAPLRVTLQHIAHGGVINGPPDRVEHHGDRLKISTEPEARAMLEAVREWTYTHLAEEHRSSTGLEAVARRAYETIAKVSLILAVPSGVRTTVHVAWATAYALQDIKEKVRAVIAHEEDGDRGITAKVLGALGPEPSTLGAIRNAHALRGLGEEVILSTLSSLVAKGRALKTERPDRRSKNKTIPVWTLAGKE